VMINASKEGFIVSSYSGRSNGTTEALISRLPTMPHLCISFACSLHQAKLGPICALIGMPNKTMCVEGLACIQFERNNPRFKSAHATKFLTNRLQHISAVACSKH